MSLACWDQCLDFSGLLLALEMLPTDPSRSTDLSLVIWAGGGATTGEGVEVAVTPFGGELCQLGMEDGCEIKETASGEVNGVLAAEG